MKQGDLSSAPARLHDAIQKLMIAWDEVRPLWNDAVSAKFAAEHLEPLFPQTQSVMQQMRSLGVVIQKAAHDCEQ